MSSSVSFINILQFQLFTSLVKFIPKYFIASNALVSEFGFFLFQVLFLYGNDSDFCILILYPATLLKLLISSNSVLVESRIFSIYDQIMNTGTDLPL